MFQDTKKIAGRLGMGTSSWLEGVSQGIFPSGIKRGTKWTRWQSTEVEAVAHALAAGATDDELRRLSRCLERERLAQRPAIDGDAA